MRRDKTPIPFAPVDVSEADAKKSMSRRLDPEDGFLAMLSGGKPAKRTPKKKRAGAK
jgi:hypothetical protein